PKNDNATRVSKTSALTSDGVLCEDIVPSLFRTYLINRKRVRYQRFGDGPRREERAYRLHRSAPPPNESILGEHARLGRWLESPAAPSPALRWRLAKTGFILAKGEHLCRRRRRRKRR